MYRYKLIKIYLNVLLIFFGIFIVFITNGYYEKAIINSTLDEFKLRAVYLKQDSKNKNIHYYKVLKKYDYEDVSRNTFQIDFGYIGSKADIIVTNRNPLRGRSIIEPLFGYFSKNFFLGHCTINSNDDGSKMYEVVGNDLEGSEYNIVCESTNDWRIYLTDSNTLIIIGLRLKNTSIAQRDSIVEYLEAQVGKGYNYTFLFNRENSYYCTDLVSRATKSSKINVNYDYFITTGNDIIISKNTYIFFLREIVIVEGKPRYNIYFLENE